MAKKTKNILLVGNPNVGKSTVFNHLCNRQQKTGNYAGVTVDSYTKDDVKKVRMGFECGLMIKGYNEIMEGDQLECFDIVEVARSL